MLGPPYYFPSLKALFYSNPYSLERLDFRLAVIPNHDPGRNDAKREFLTFYEGVILYIIEIHF
jgi:hypothetical protein